MVLLGKFCCKVAIAGMTEHGLVFRTDAVSCTPMWIPTFQPSDRGVKVVCLLVLDGVAVC